MTNLPLRHLNQVELSRRWSLSPRTLERWRWLRQGPRYVKIGGRVVYRIEDIEAYEQANTLSPEGGTRLARQRRAAAHTDGRAA